MNTYIGIDCSTQQLKITVIDENFTVLHEVCVHYDSELPEFGTKNGVIHGSDGKTVISPTLMWVSALDIGFDKLKNLNFDFKTVKGLSGCGQQHGSVYWNKGSEQTLMKLNPSDSLKHQLKNAFSISQSPIWQDFSTEKQCRELENVLGGPENLLKITGSRAYERFTGAQILKIFQENPVAYESSERISLVSSFLSSILIQAYAPIDTSDASGMNLLDIKTRKWNETLLHHCGGPNLKFKLGDPVESDQIIGNIGNYFIQKYGFSLGTPVLVFTGDNPATLSSLSPSPGTVIISLGTSDTLFLSIQNPVPSMEAHTLCHPTLPQEYMAMIVYKNGSLAREAVRDQYTSDKSWHSFNTLVNRGRRLRQEGKLKSGQFGFYYFLPEITPKCYGQFKFEEFSKVDEFSENPDVINCLSVLESQFLSMLVYSKRMGLSTINKLIVTGGAAQNDTLLQMIADIFGQTVWKVNGVSNSASLGCAMRAKYGFEQTKSNFKSSNKSYEDVVGNVVNENLEIGATPSPQMNKLYHDLQLDFIKAETIVQSLQK